MGIIDPIGTYGRGESPGGVTPLMHAACLEKPDELLVLLAKASKEDIDDQDVEGYTALHYAALRGFSDHVSILLDAGAYPFCKNNGGETPRDLATKRGHVEASVMLLKAEEQAPLIKPEDLPARVVQLEKIVEELRLQLAEMAALKNAEPKEPEKATASPPRPPAGGP